MCIQASPAQHIGTVRPHIRAIHRSVYERIWQTRIVNISKSVVLRVLDAVQHTNSPTVMDMHADPGTDIPLAPCWHRMYPRTPEGPDVLLRCHRAEGTKALEDFLVASFVSSLTERKLVPVRHRDVEFLMRHESQQSSQRKVSNWQSNMS